MITGDKREEARSHWPARLGIDHGIAGVLTDGMVEKRLRRATRRRAMRIAFVGRRVSQRAAPRWPCGRGHRPSVRYQTLRHAATSVLDVSDLRWRVNAFEISDRTMRAHSAQNLFGSWYNVALIPLSSWCRGLLSAILFMA